MKRLTVRAAVLASLLFLSAGTARADFVIGFDDFKLAPGSFQQVANGYMGLNWTNTYVINTQPNPLLPPGYAGGTVSPPNAAFNGFGTPLTLSSAHAFDFLGGNFSAASGAWLNLEVLGYRQGVLKDQASVFVGGSSARDLQFNFRGVDSVQLVPKPAFIPSGAASPPGGVFSGWDLHFVMDDLHFGAEPGRAAAPEPCSLVLLGVGGSLLGFAGCRRRWGRLA
jgi:hypothetical protein